ncbi:MAG: hypothetical protein AAF436_20350, partial [Myxococcota bacterium]
QQRRTTGLEPRAKHRSIARAEGRSPERRDADQRRSVRHLWAEREQPIDTQVRHLVPRAFAELLRNPPFGHVSRFQLQPAELEPIAA